MPSGHPPRVLFFCFLSGLSGLIYQVVWVREFGNVFGHTIYTASLVVAIFMLGLGCGSYMVGAWADRRYATSPNRCCARMASSNSSSPLSALAISLLLPRLHGCRGACLRHMRRMRPAGIELSTMSYVARGAIAARAARPITLLMGGTLTLLIRHRVREDVERAAR